MSDESTGVAIVATITVENTSKKPILVSPYDFGLYDKKENVYISVFNPSSPSLAEMDSLFVEHNGYVSIDAAGFHRKVENKAIQMRTIPNLGIENTAIQLGDPAAAPQRTAGRSNTSPGI